jgi:transcriptional regulator with XRE-family HTH domain
MNQRLQQFLSAENISQAQFADSIDVARASVSHVLAGRNRPGYDFIRSIAEHYPKLNLEWLITGKGKMYKQDSPAVAPAPSPLPATAEPATADSLFGDSSFATEEKEEDIPASPVKAAPGAPETAPVKDLPAASRSISRIIVFYDDNTYQELK